MKKTFQKLRQINKSLKKCSKELQNIRQLPFYSLFKQETQRTADEESLNVTIQELLVEKAALLKKLKQKITNAQHTISKQAA